MTQRKVATPRKATPKKLTREQIIEHVLGEVAGGRPLATILAEDKGMPGKSTFWRWHMADESLRDNLARAREHGADALVDEAIHIANTPQEGETVTEDAIVIKGQKIPVVKTVRGDMLGHRRLQVDTRIKAAQMIAPRKYGPKLDLTSNGQTIYQRMMEAEARQKRLEEEDRG